MQGFSPKISSLPRRKTTRRRKKNNNNNSDEEHNDDDCTPNDSEKKKLAAVTAEPPSHSTPPPPAPLLSAFTPFEDPEMGGHPPMPPPENTPHAGRLEFSPEKAGLDVTPLNLEFGDRQPTSLNPLSGANIIILRFFFMFYLFIYLFVNLFFS